MSTTEIIGCGYDQPVESNTASQDTTVTTVTISHRSELNDPTALRGVHSDKSVHSDNSNPPINNNRKTHIIFLHL